MFQLNSASYFCCLYPESYTLLVLAKCFLTKLVNERYLFDVKRNVDFFTVVLKQYSNRLLPIQVWQSINKAIELEFSNRYHD